MSDSFVHTKSQPASEAAAVSPPGGLRHRTVYGVAGLLAAVIGWYLVTSEGSGWNLFYAVGGTAVLAFCVLVVTRRVLVTALVASAAVAIILAASAVKLELMHMALHAYDVVFYLTSAATLSFLVQTYPLEMAQLGGAFLALGVGWYYAHKLDGTRIARAYSIAGLVALIGLTHYASYRKDAMYAFRQFEGGFTLTKFYASWSDALETLLRGQLLEAAPLSNGPPFTIPTSCALNEKPPHIILIHQESAVPPEFFPNVAYDKTMDRMFRSSDGQLRKMRVETFAGGSWLTEFSMLTGLSTYSFGSMRPFVQSLMAGRIHDTLPERLAACGYRNTVFYPLHRNFVSNARLYTAVGMPEIYDIKDQKARTSNERDRFYYDNMMGLIGQHVRSSSAPFFSFVLTSATHQPYHSTYAPEMVVPGGDGVKDPQMHEYLRRLSLARLDLEYLERELARRFPAERFLIVHYGDHQPTATYPYLGERDHAAIGSGDRELVHSSLAYLTYYALVGVNYEIPKIDRYDTLDVPYLGVEILKAARVPMSPSFQERDRLAQICNGRYDGCDKRGQILGFHRRLIESGLVETR